MRIGLVHPYAWPEVRRGAERYVEDLATHLAAQGHDVCVVAGTGDRPEEWRRPDGVAVVRLPHRHGRGAWRLGLSEVELFGLSALPWLRRRPLDVVHAMVPSAAVAGRLAGRPTLYTVLGHPSADQLPERFAPRRLLAAAVRRSTATAALSRASAEALGHSLGHQALVLPPGIRLCRFPPELSPRSGPPVVLFSASLADPRKRAPLALEAFTLFRRRHPGARLVLSGPGEPAELLSGVDDATRAAVETPGVGVPDEIPGRYRRATVTFLPAAREAFGLCLVESLACGTPVVCTDEGGMAELVDPTVGRVAAASPAALAVALEEAVHLAAQPSTPARCAGRARRWDWETVVGPAHVEIYRALAAGRTPGPSSLGSGEVIVPTAVPASRTTVHSTPNS